MLFRRRKTREQVIEDRWAEINKRTIERGCLCGRPTEVVLSDGPALFARCSEHADVSLTTVWKPSPDGHWEPGDELEWFG